MARIRSVHPDICLSETMAGLPAHLERTFVRLWTHCDDEGRCADNPRLIKAAIYPLHDDVDWIRVNQELSELEEYGLIVRYEVAGEKVVQVWSWGQYQKPQRPSESKLPAAPSGTRPRVVREGSQQVLIPLHAGEGEGEGEGEGVIAPVARSEAQLELDAIKAALVEMCGKPPPQNWSLLNRIATWIRDNGGTPDDVRYRAGLIAEEWGKKALTLTSIEKYWTRWDAAVGQITEADVTEFKKVRDRESRRQRILGGAG